jgi:hypothetical protein
LVENALSELGVAPNIDANMVPTPGTKAAANNTSTRTAKAPRTMVFKGKPCAFIFLDKTDLYLNVLERNV